MRRLLIGLTIIFLLAICGCSSVKEEIVFLPDQTAKETAGGYKNKFSVSEKPQQNGTIYYFNTESKKFHLETCRYKDSCKENRTTDKEKLLKDGYTACKVCNP